MNVTATGKRTLESGEQHIMVTATNKAVSMANTIKLFMDKFVNIKQSDDTSVLFSLEDLIVTPSSQETAISYPVACTVTGSISDTSADSPENFMLTVDLEMADVLTASAVYTAINTVFRSIQRQDSQALYDIEDAEVKVSSIQISVK